jgi:pimeloyl-ACP methyl ester carboxylesterase
MTVLHLPGGEIVAGGEEVSIAIELLFPQRPADARMLLLCIPGGSVNRHYFDLRDGEDDRFSFARAMTGRGHVVALIDPPGVGESSRPADGFLLTVENEIDVLTRAIIALESLTIDGVNLADLIPVGVGHSAGAMLTVARQARYQDCAALIMLGFGTKGLPDHLTDEHRLALAGTDGGRSRIAEFARARFGNVAYVPSRERQVDSPAGRAMAAVRDVMVAPIGLQAMTPGNVAPEVASIDIPVFCAVGDRDMVGPPHELAGDYVACPDFTLLRLPDTGHSLFVSASTGRLFDRVSSWLADLANLD